MPSAVPASSLVGHVLGGRYRLERLIGQGGMGAVYEGVHVHLERRHAVKVLHGEHAHDGEWVARFHREALLTSKIASPHVVVISDVGVTDDGTRYAVMELLAGEDLGARLARGPLAIGEAIDIVRQVLAGVGAAHALGVVHRDLKPDNVFLVPGGGGAHGVVAKILDFGICKPVVSDAASPALTAAGLAVGTPLYMPPEQLLGQPVDGRADVYAAAVMLYQLLAGEPPYVGATFTELAARHLADDIPDVRARRPEVPPAVAAALRRAMAKDAGDRFPSAHAFAQALGDAAAAGTTSASALGSVEAPPPRVSGATVAALALTTVDARRPGRRRRGGLVLGAAVTVAAGAAIASGVASQRGGAPSRATPGAPAAAAGSGGGPPPPSPRSASPPARDQPPPAAPATGPAKVAERPEPAGSAARPSAAGAAGAPGGAGAASITNAGAPPPRRPPPPTDAPPASHRPPPSREPEGSKPNPYD